MLVGFFRWVEPVGLVGSTSFSGGVRVTVGFESKGGYEVLMLTVLVGSVLTLDSLIKIYSLRPNLFVFFDFLVVKLTQL